MTRRARLPSEVNYCQRMDIETARRLKAELVSSFQRFDVPEPAGLGRTFREATVEPPTAVPFALGIASAPAGQYRLAVRVQDEWVVNSGLVEEIEQTARGEVEVRYIGPAEPLGAGTRSAWQRSVSRPLRGGVSIGVLHGQTTGTLACFVRARTGGPTALLTNNHVIADQDRAPAGVDVFQPGWDDGGRPPRDVVATLLRAVPFRLQAMNEVDCAMAALVDGIEFEPRLADSRSLSDVSEIDAGDRVEAVGRTSGSTVGVVSAIETGPVTFKYQIGPLRFDNLVEIEGVGDGPFARKGDSGSLVVAEGTSHPIALVFGVTLRGGSNGAGVTYASPLSTVLDALDVTLVS